MLDFSPLNLTHLFLAALSFSSVFVFIKLALRHKSILRWHAQHTARFAGIILIATTTLLALWVLDQTSLKLGLLGAALLVIIIGTLDEIRDLSPLAQLVGQLVIAASVVGSGWTIQQIANPWADGVIVFSGSVAVILTIIWLVFLMNSINWLDGADALAPSVSVVALLTLAAISLLPSTQESTTLVLALIGAGGAVAFLIWNWPPAKVYLGTSGSWFLGLYIGLIAIIGGGKIASTLLVLALPALDAILVSFGRLAAGRAPWRGDTTNHLHHRLLAYGVSKKMLPVLAIIISAALGTSAVILQTRYKLITLAIVGIILLISTTSLWRHQPEA